MTDATLIAAAQAGDAKALDALVTRHEPRVYRFSYRLTGNADDAAEVAQETLIAMARSLKTFRGDASLSTWLYSVARRLAIKRSQDRAARATREVSLDDDGAAYRDTLAAPVQTPEQATSDRETDLVITRALAALNPAQREVVVLRDIEGLTAPEAARVLGIGVRAVKSRLHRGRLALRVTLAPLVGGALESPKPGCRDILRLFSRYLDGDLSGKTCKDLEQHLSRCGTCTGACESLKRVLAVCKHAPAQHLPAALGRSLRRAVQQIQAQTTSAVAARSGGASR